MIFSGGSPRRGSRSPSGSCPGGFERLSFEEHYFSLILSGLINPVIESPRGLCAANHFNNVQ